MIETKNLTKTFDNFTAVDSLNLKIEKGEFFGLLGPNGAGKTTTISLLSTLLLPTKGEILIDGQQLVQRLLALVVAAKVGAAVTLLADRIEIGRASCRERV